MWNPSWNWSRPWCWSKPAEAFLNTMFTAAAVFTICTCNSTELPLPKHFSSLYFVTPTFFVVPDISLNFEQFAQIEWFACKEYWKLANRALCLPRLLFFSLHFPKEYTYFLYSKKDILLIWENISNLIQNSFLTTVNFYRILKHMFTQQRERKRARRKVLKKDDITMPHCYNSHSHQACHFREA